jgi:hypothetical protein
VDKRRSRKAASKGRKQRAIQATGDKPDPDADEARRIKKIRAKKVAERTFEEKLDLKYAAEPHKEYRNGHTDPAVFLLNVYAGRCDHEGWVDFAIERLTKDGYSKSRAWLEKRLPSPIEDALREFIGIDVVPYKPPLRRKGHPPDNSTDSQKAWDEVRAAWEAIKADEEAVLAGTLSKPEAEAREQVHVQAINAASPRCIASPEVRKGFDQLRRQTSPPGRSIAMP